MRLKDWESKDIVEAIEIKDRIGEQKIDILIIDTDPPKDPFSQIALEHALSIKKW